MPSSRFPIAFSYALDFANFLSVLTGDPFYVQYHQEAYALWGERLSDRSKEAMASARAARGSAMLGPAISHLVSAIPGFAERDLLWLLTQPESHYEGWPYYQSAWWPKTREIMAHLLPVLEELERLGFREYWTRERLPLIQRAAAEMGEYLAALPLDVGKAAAAMLGAGEGSAPFTLYLCTFAAPHGIRLSGPAYISDVTYQPAETLRIAIHEMFHPPYSLDQVRPEADRLMADPLFQDAFQTKDPKYGYDSAEGFLEENVVEAMELHVSKAAGLIADQIGYLMKHDDGSHKLSVVLVKYFAAVPREPAEEFAAYFRRLVGQMPLGRLDEEYTALVEAWRREQGLA